MIFPVYVLPWSSPEKEQPSSIAKMAEIMISMMRKVQPNGPYAVAGYCAGGILACEITIQLIGSGHVVSFLGLIDSYLLTSAWRWNETDTFLEYLKRKSSYFKALTDLTWWTRVSKLTLTEALEELKGMNSDLTISDIEWEALLSKQRVHYIKLCIAHDIKSLPLKVNYFKAIERLDDNDDDTVVGCWENYKISSIDYHNIPGNHFTMMTDPKNRNILANKLNQLFRSNFISR